MILCQGLVQSVPRYQSRATTRLCVRVAPAKGLWSKENAAPGLYSGCRTQRHVGRRLCHRALRGRLGSRGAHIHSRPQGWRLSAKRGSANLAGRHPLARRRHAHTAPSNARWANGCARNALRQLATACGRTPARPILHSVGLLRAERLDWRSGRAAPSSMRLRAVVLDRLRQAAELGEVFILRKGRFGLFHYPMRRFRAVRQQVNCRLRHELRRHDNGVIGVME